MKTWTLSLPCASLPIPHILQVSIIFSTVMLKMEHLDPVGNVCKVIWEMFSDMVTWNMARWYPGEVGFAGAYHNCLEVEGRVTPWTRLQGHKQTHIWPLSYVMLTCIMETMANSVTNPIQCFRPKSQLLIPLLVTLEMKIKTPAGVIFICFQTGPSLQ